MVKTPDKATTQRAQTIFAEWFERTGNHRVAADRAGVSERTGRRWRRRQTVAVAPSPPAREAKTNLAVEPTRFIGRQAALQSIRSVFASGARLVTVLGPAGIGKTRLALRYADLHLYDYAKEARGGVWFSDLTEARTAEDICGAVGHALGVPLAAEGGRGIDSADQLGHALASRGLILLTLDNFEQATGHALATVGRWMTLAPKAHFLVTSRESLGLPGEVSWHLESLEVPDPQAASDPRKVAATEAVQLFVDRTRLVRPDYDVSPADAATVAELVRHLDGIPLAIELCAARMAVLHPAQLLVRLKTRFDLLAGSARGVAPRQTSMRRAIDWSWGLLAPAEQSALAQCSIFHGGFTLEAAERVIDVGEHKDAPSVLDVIQALRHKSLLRVQGRADGDAALRMGMYESIAAYAAERLGERADLAAAVGERHARYYLDVAGEWAHRVGQLGSVETRKRLFLELDNLTAVHQWALARVADPVASRQQVKSAAEDALRAALAMLPILSARGARGADLAVLDAAIQASRPGVEPGLLRRALLARSDLMRLQGPVAMAEIDAEQVLAEARAHGDRALEGFALASLGRLYYFAGRLEESKKVSDEALQIALSLRDRHLEARAVGNLANVLRFRRRLKEALALAERALALHRETGNARFEGDVLCLVAGLYQGQRRMEEARDCYERALKILREIGDPVFEATVLGNLGTLHNELGDLEEAHHYVLRALDMFRELGIPRLEACALANLGLVHLEAGRLDESRTVFLQALELLRLVEDTILQGACLAYLGGVLASMGRIDEARASIEAAERIYVPFEKDPLVEVVRVQHGHVELALARGAEAKGDVEAARGLRDAVRQRIALVESADDQESGQPDDVRVTVRILKRALEQDETSPASLRGSNAGSADALVVSEDARAFRTPTARTVKLERRRAVRLVLLKLVDHRQKAPGEALSPEALLQSGWPGERVLPEAGASRVYVALATLRKLGLRGLLVSRDGGYLLDPEVPLLVVPSLR